MQISQLKKHDEYFPHIFMLFRKFQLYIEHKITRFYNALHANVTTRLLLRVYDVPVTFLTKIKFMQFSGKSSVKISSYPRILKDILL